MNYKNTIGCVVLTLFVTVKMFALPQSELDTSNWSDVALKDFKGTVDYDLRKTVESGYLAAFGDFDGDGRADVAKIVVNKQNTLFAVVVFLESKSGRNEHILVSGTKSEIARIAVSKIIPGQYKTACGKGYGRCSSDAAQEIVIETNGISVVMFEASETLYYWTGSKFAKIWLSD